MLRMAKHDEQQIREVIQQWQQRTREGDLDAVLAFMTDDAIFLRCGQPPMTRKEFADGFRAWSGQAQIESKFEIKEVHASGDLGYAWSHISISMTQKDSGATTRREGHVLSVFRKSAAGTWQLARDANLIP
jgi:uncharacterized protein (TIGR02246 family)